MRFPFCFFVLLIIPAFCAAETPESKMPLGSLDETIRSLRETSPPVAAYLDSCDALAWSELPFGQPIVLPQIPLNVLVDDARSDTLHGSLRYYLALKLVQAKLYDESETVLNEVVPEKTLEPCGVLIHKALVFYHQHKTEKGLEALEAFRKAAENDTSVPRRYTELAKLLDFELQKEKKEQENSPEKIAKKMSNVQQRLGKGQTGDKTQEAEKDVMKSLEQLIEKIEEQSRRQAQEGQPQGGEGQQANRPADDSRILKQKGPGNVDRKEFELDGSWGNLPPKEREEALIKIEKEFPAHYRELIEEYFREMAGREDSLD